MADETGLGKTHVAREVIAQTIEHLQETDHVKRIDIVYVCSNADIRRSEHPQAQHHRFGELELCDPAELADHNARDAEAHGSWRE